MTISIRRGSEPSFVTLPCPRTCRFALGRLNSAWICLVLATASLTTLAGCGGSKEPATTEGAKPAETSAVAASGEATPVQEPAVPQEGTPEREILELMVLRAEPLTDSKDPKEIEAARRTRHQKM